MTVETGRLAPDAVRTMFDRISPVYDAMNRTMTLGLDRRWRRAAAEAVVRYGDRVLDACCGTGDLAIAAKEAGGGSVTGLDFSPRMLERARAKSREIEWVQGDVLALPFDDASFDAATVGFGVRNLDDLERGPGRAPARPPARRSAGDSRDHAAPRSARAVLPALVRPARAAPRAGASGRIGLHLPPASVRRFPGPEDLGALLREAGFEDVRWRLYAGWIVALHTGEATA